MKDKAKKDKAKKDKATDFVLDSDGYNDQPSENALPIHQFSGRGQKNTPVAPLKTLLTIINTIPGNGLIVQFRVHCCELLCRVFAGDPNLKTELDNNFVQMVPSDRRDLLIDVPGAAPVDIDAHDSTPDNSKAIVVYGSTDQEDKFICVKKFQKMEDPFYDIGRPDSIQAHNVVYLICLGVWNGRVYWKYGKSGEFDFRSTNHFNDFSEMGIVVIFDCGLYALQHIEKTVKIHVRKTKEVVKVNNQSKVECFSCPVGEARIYIEGLISQVEKVHKRTILQRYFYDGKVIEVGDDKFLTGSLRMEQEKTTQIQEQEKTKQIQEQEKTKQAQEKTKQMLIELEMLKLRASMNM